MIVWNMYFLSNVAIIGTISMLDMGLYYFYIYIYIYLSFQGTGEIDQIRVQLYACTYMSIFVYLLQPVLCTSQSP